MFLTLAIRTTITTGTGLVGIMRNYECVILQIAILGIETELTQVKW